MFRRLLLAGLALVLLASCSHAPRQAMVATANRHASEAAIEMLRQGGSATDAAIAAQLVLGLVEPQSSGLGGGAFMLHYDAATNAVTAWDGRETAPAAATPARFMKADGKPMTQAEASIGGLGVGVPGTVALLFEAHRTHGRLPWPKLFEPAIRLAENGFAVSRRLSEAIAQAPELAQDPDGRVLFFLSDPEDPKKLLPLPEGRVLRNPAYAASLRRIAAEGPDGFYKGPIAAAIVQAVRNHPNPGDMTLEDLEAYRAIRREAVCRPYRGHEVCGMPPPTSGGLTSLMILGMLENYRVPDLRPNSLMASHLISQASRMAFADRNFYMADADFVPVPAEGLTQQAYLRSRARTIDPGRDMGEAQPGRPPGTEGLLRAAALPSPEYGTSHLSIVDLDGNAVSMTMTIEQSMGGHLMAAGFLLNNELTDFSFRPDLNGRPVANRVEGGKRPRSSMAPTLVFAPGGELFAAVGSPGGARIIGYVAQALVALVDWKMPMQDAVALPHVLNRNGAVELEKGTDAEALAPALTAMGYEVKVQALESGLQGIRVRHGRLDGGADPRREGVVLELTR